MEYLNFIFSSFWTYLGSLIFLLVIVDKVKSITKAILEISTKIKRKENKNDGELRNKPIKE